MLVKIFLDPETLLQNCYNRAAHTRFLDAWISTGIGYLIDINVQDKSWLQSNINKIGDPNIKTLWEKAFTHSIKIKAITSYRCKRNVEHLDYALAKSISDHSDLIATYPNSAKRFQSKAQDIKSEIALFDEIDQSKIYRDCIKLKETGIIPANTPIEDIWDTRFKDQFNAATEMSIVDSYALHAANYRGFENFLKLAIKFKSANSPKKTITLYCSPSDKEMHTSNLRPGQSEIQILKDIFSRLDDSLDWFTLNVVVNSLKEHRRAYHDRHVRIGQRVVYPLGKGLDIFNTPTFSTTQASTIAFQASTENVIVVERQLKQSARTVCTFPENT